jgi:multidrug efflux pump subunit AcrA (membrane-fusion protein)
VPNGAIKGTPGNYWVEVMPEGKGVEKRPVTTGLRNRSYTEIVSGLREGERVSLDNARPQPKQPVALK